MDARSLLTAQGWRGKGHSLHAHDDSIGLKNPLYLSRKNNTHGLGTKNGFEAEDQWWLSAYDEQLKGLQPDEEGKLVQTVTTGKLNTVGSGERRVSLYANFVRGGLLEGTILGEEEGAGGVKEGGAKDTEGGREVKEVRETKEERKKRKEAKRLRREERRARKEEKKREEKIAIIGGRVAEKAEQKKPGSLEVATEKKDKRKKEKTGDRATEKKAKAKNLKKQKG